jgi:hypothetical protein
MTEQWFQFIAYNKQEQYGFGFEEEADTYRDLLNDGREVHLYWYCPMSANETAGLDSGDNTDGFRLEDAIATILENRERELIEKREHASNLDEADAASEALIALKALIESRKWK